MHQNTLLYVPNEQLTCGIYVYPVQNNVRGTIPRNKRRDFACPLQSNLSAAIRFGMKRQHPQNALEKLELQF